MQRSGGNSRWNGFGFSVISIAADFFMIPSFILVTLAGDSSFAPLSFDMLAGLEPRH